MHRSLVPVLFAAMACNPNYDLVETTPEVVASPSLIDFGEIATGTETVDTFQLDVVQSRGESQVRSIEITGPGADQFRYAGEDGFEITWDHSAVQDLVFAPTVPGWHNATVEIVHAHVDADKEKRIEIPVRGHALDPQIEIVPWAVDFGPVPTGQTGQKQVLVRNLTDLDITVSAAVFSDPDSYATTASFPLDIQGGFERTLTVTYTAGHDGAVNDTMTLQVGQTNAAVLDMTANDCAQGLPEAYDQDGDGYTLCAGDCDDLDLDVHPGADEVWDGVDQDCDGIADEGTAGYDDDGDGYCEGPGTCTYGTLGDGDCHDANSAINPAQAEIWGNGIDDDCDGQQQPSTTDADGDGYSPGAGDCDDGDPTTYPGAPELPDYVNNDCDGLTDEGTVMFDDDGDGYCEGPVCSDGSMPGDCHDGDANTRPYAPELEDWIDNDCDGLIDDGTDHDDTDGDGYSELGGDCDDSDPANNPSIGLVCP